FIGGTSVQPESGDFLDKSDPRTGRVISRVARGTAKDVDAAAEAAFAAWAEWRDRRPIERGRVLLDIARAMRAKVAELAEIEIREAGKPNWQGPIEIEGAAQYFEFYGGLVNLPHGEIIDLGANYHSYTRREPFGVVGVILPWNAPLNQAARAIAP